jgi:hypothetical protein
MLNLHKVCYCYYVKTDRPSGKYLRTAWTFSQFLQHSPYSHIFTVGNNPWSWVPGSVIQPHNPSGHRQHRSSPMGLRGRRCISARVELDSSSGASGKRTYRRSALDSSSAATCRIQELSPAACYSSERKYCSVAASWR